MLEVDNLTSRYGRIEVLHGISLEVREGEIVTWSASTAPARRRCLRVMSGVQPISGGSVRFAGYRYFRCRRASTCRASASRRCRRAARCSRRCRSRTI